MLPDEIILYIMEKCQPGHIEITNDWIEPLDSIWHYGYQSSIELSYKIIPIIIVLGQVNKRWRGLSRLHSFWTVFRPIYLVPRRLRYTQAQADAMQYYAEQTGFRNIRSIQLDFLSFQYASKPQQLIQLLKCIQHPERVESLVLSDQWLTMGDPLVWKVLFRFKGLKRLFIKGKVHPGVFEGLDSKIVLKMAKVWSNLTHLYLDSYGSQKFSWRALKKLLMANPSIECLNLGPVRMGIQFNDLHVLPKLHTLCLRMHYCELQDYQGSLVDIPLKRLVCLVDADTFWPQDWFDSLVHPKTRVTMYRCQP